MSINRQLRRDAVQLTLRLAGAGDDSATGLAAAAGATVTEPVGAVLHATAAGTLVQAPGDGSEGLTPSDPRALGGGVKGPSLPVAEAGVADTEGRAAADAAALQKMKSDLAAAQRRASRQASLLNSHFAQTCSDE